MVPPGFGASAAESASVGWPVGDVTVPAGGVAGRGGGLVGSVAAGAAPGAGAPRKSTTVCRRMRVLRW